MPGKSYDKKAQSYAPDAIKEYRFRKGVDIPFLTVLIILVCAGIVMIATASYVYAGSRFGDNLHFLKRHVIFVVVGLAAMFVVSNVPYEIIRKFTYIIFGISFLMLIAVLAFSADANGAKRWIYIGPLSFQPSEIMKFAVILLCADYIDKYHKHIALPGQDGSFFKIVLPFLASLGFGAVFAVLGFFSNFIFGKLFGSTEEILSNGETNPYYGIISFFDKVSVPLAIIGIILVGLSFYIALKRDMRRNAPDFLYGILPFGLVIVSVALLLALEPHMSGLIIISALVVILMILGGCSMKYIMGCMAVGGAGIYALLNVFSHSKSRLEVWKDPFSYLDEKGWQPAQSLYAIGNGGFWGVGLGQSRQKHLYLPEPMNDYIFAILCEEFGFVGALCTILMFVFLVYRGIVISFRAPDRFSSLVVLGIVVQVGLQALLNMMVVTNTIPSTGISLPFFSYGGTSLVILLAEMGVVLSISRYSVIEKNTTIEGVRA